MMLFNQKYQRKLARKEWLVNGDRNSKFFQNNANSKRKRKIVMKLLDDCGIWIEDHKMIAEKFISDYMQRFKSTHNNARLLPNLELWKLISYLGNYELIKLPNLEELKMPYSILILIKHQDQMVLVRVSLKTIDKSLRRIFLTILVNSS